METNVWLAKLNKIPPGMVLERQRFGRTRTYCVWTEARKIAELGAYLRDSDDFRLDWLENISAAQLDRAFVITYFLRSRSEESVLTVRISVDVPSQRDEEVEVPSVRGIWESARNFESDISDLFGIHFRQDGSEERITRLSCLTGEKGFGGFPLRKDYSRP